MVTRHVTAVKAFGVAFGAHAARRATAQRHARRLSATRAYSDAPHMVAPRVVAAGRAFAADRCRCRRCWERADVVFLVAREALRRVATSFAELP